MSGSGPYAFADADIVDIRRFCGYPAYGYGNAGFQSWRYFQAYGLLEYRLRNLSADEAAVIETYLTTLRGLETAVPGAGANLDTDRAAVWFHNKNEVRDRLALFDEWRRRLCQMFGVPPGPSLSSGQSRILV